MYTAVLVQSVKIMKTLLNNFLVPIIDTFSWQDEHSKNFCVGSTEVDLSICKTSGMVEDYF